ncbi:MAG: TIM-barrel domain-containing protein [Ferruginibacter sp.]
MNRLLKTTYIVAFLSSTFSTSAQQPANKTVSRITTMQEVEIPQGKWVFSLYPHNIIKATFTAVGSQRNEQVSDAVIARPVSQPASIEKNNDHVTVVLSNAASISINPSGVDFNAGRGISVSLINMFYSDETRGFKFSLASGEKIYGAGERSITLNRRGYKLNLNNVSSYGYSINAAALNFSVPFILSSKKYAIFFDNPSKGFLDIGKTDPQILEYSVTSGELSFYIIPGENYESIMESYQSLVGTAPLPPRWAMGNLMSRFGYRNEKQTREIIEKMKKDSIPFDAVIFDPFWFGDSIQNTLGNLQWVNKTAWPDPKKMISDFKKENIKTILVTQPFVLKTSLNYDESKNLLAVDSAGNPYTLQDFYFGKGGIIDIFRKDAQQWFYKKYKTQMDIGVAGWWGDLGEPENHPADVYHNLKDLGFKRKFAAGEVHNVYAYYWSKMLAENFKKDYPGERLFHLNRSGYAGSPRYNSFPWSGDVSRSWDGLKAQIPLIQSMSMSGIPYMHSDAGGFAGGDGDDELYIRWLQFAAFTPIYRPHGTALGAVAPNVKDIPSEAAWWPEPTLTRARNAARIRYKWLPYNYNLAYLQTKSGKPLMTPMFFLNDNDSNLYKAANQYMWGEEVMVVPVTEKGQTVLTFYVPYGKWTNLNNFKSYVGPHWVTDSSVNIESIPVFAKEGSFIPFMPGMLNTADYNKGILNVLYAPSAGKSKYELYEDDGRDANAIRTRLYEITTFSCDGMKQSTTITINSNLGKYKGRVENRKMIINILNMKQPPTSIKVNGKLLSLTGLWDETRKIIKIPMIFQHKKTQIVIDF